MRKIFLFFLAFGCSTTIRAAGTDALSGSQQLITTSTDASKVGQTINRILDNVLPRNGGDNLFYRDTTNQRIGINTSTPTVALEVRGAILASSVTVSNMNSLLKYKVGTFASPSSAGLGSVTGVGFRPRLLIVGYGAGDSSAFLFALGWTGGVGNNVSIVGLRSDGSDSGGRSTTTGALIEVCNAAGTVTNTGLLSSFDTDGFTIDWTTVSGANTYGYIAFQ